MTRESLASQLNIQLRTLDEFAANKDSYYMPERREHKGNGRLRTINEPLRPLMKIQSALKEIFFYQVDFAEYLTGGIKRRNHIDGVRLHAKRRSVLSEDIKDFFPSVSFHIIEQIWRVFFGCPPEVANLLTELTTYRGYLPQGAPTSTYLANLVFFDNEPGMVREFAELGLKYSRHVDDMNLSAIRLLDDKTVSFVRSRIETVLNTRGCTLNVTKSRLQNRSMPCRVHGLLINAGRPTKGRKQIANIRAAINELEKRVTESSAGQEEIEILFRTGLGRVSELQQYQATKAQPMRARLNELKKVASQRWPTFLAPHFKLASHH